MEDLAPGLVEGSVIEMEQGIDPSTVPLAGEPSKYAAAWYGENGTRPWRTMPDIIPTISSCRLVAEQAKKLKRGPDNRWYRPDGTCPDDSYREQVAA